VPGDQPLIDRVARHKQRPGLLQVRGALHLKLFGALMAQPLLRKPERGRHEQ
jgi:hypothetical protein